MKTEIKTVLLSTVLASGLVAQHEPPKAAEPTPAEAAQPAPTAEQWIKQLGSESYRDRLQAEQKLRELGEEARVALERAAGDDSDREVQWRSKRLLRQLDRAKESTGLQERSRADGATGLQERDPAPRRRHPSRSVDDLRAEFDRVFRRFEDEFGIDVPRFRFFDDPFFRDLRSQLKADARQQGMSLQIGPDGVHVEITETGKDGKVEKKTYDAPDLETFERLHPGLLKDSGLGMGFSLRGFDPDGLARPPLPLPLPLRPRAVPAAPAPTEGRRLGVTVKDVPPLLRDYLELDEGVGLMVASVQADTLAAAVGLRPNDIVVAINGAGIGAPADVARALGAIAKGDEVRIEFVRKGRRQEATTTKRHDAVEHREPLPQKTRARGTIR